MRTRRTRQTAKAGNRKKRKKEVSLFQEVEGLPYTGVPNQLEWTVQKGDWIEKPRNEKTWDVLAEFALTKSFESENELPVGSEYHTYIVAQQTLIKSRKNTWKIKLEGKKVKLGQKISGSALKGNAESRRKDMIKFLKELLSELELGHGRAPAQSKWGSTAGSSNTSKTLT